MAIDASIYGNQPPPRFNTPFESLGQIGALRQQQQQIQSNQALEEERRQKVAKEKQIEADQAKFFDILSTSKTADEAAEKIRVGVPSFYQSFLKQRGEIDAKAEDVKKTAAEIKKLHAEVQVKGNEYAEPFFQLVEKSGNNPGVFEFALSHIQSQFPDFPADQYRQQAAQGGPEAIAQIVASRKSTQQQTADTGAARLAAETPTLQANAKIQGAVAANLSPDGLTPAQQVTKASGDRGAAEAARHNRVQEANSAAQLQRASENEAPVQIMGPQGAPIWVKKSDAIGKPAAQAARAVTGQERQTLAYFNRAQEAAKTVEPLEDRIGKMSLAGQARLQVAPNFLQSSENQSYRQAQRAFTEARLRKESGAAIPTSEFENDAKTYFAQPGDTPEILAQKRKARQTVLDGLAFAAGKAYDEYYGETRPKQGAQPVGGAPKKIGRFDVTVSD